MRSGYLFFSFSVVFFGAILQLGLPPHVEALEDQPPTVYPLAPWVAPNDNEYYKKDL